MCAEVEEAVRGSWNGVKDARESLPWIDALQQAFHRQHFEPQHPEGPQTDGHQLGWLLGGVCGVGCESVLRFLVKQQR